MARDSFQPGAKHSSYTSTGAPRQDRPRLSYSAREVIDEAHEAHAKLYSAKVDEGKITPPDEELLRMLEAHGPLVLAHPRVLAMLKGRNDDFQDKTTLETAASAAGVLTMSINRQNESETIKNTFASGEDVYQPMNTASKNRERLEPGMFIAVYKLERLRDQKNIHFPHPHFVSTPSGSALNKRYICVIRFITDDYISCYVLTSKKRTGFKKLPEDEYLNYVPIFEEGADYELPPGVTTALFTPGRKECQGSMLCLTEHRVHFNEWISIASGSLTVESKIRLKQLALENAYVKKHIDQILEKGEISHEVEGAVLSLGMPAPGEKVVVEGSIARRVNINADIKSSPASAANNQERKSSWVPKNAGAYRNYYDKNNSTSMYLNPLKRSHSHSYIDSDTPPRPKKAAKHGHLTGAGPVLNYDG